MVVSLRSALAKANVVDDGNLAALLEEVELDAIVRGLAVIGIVDLVTLRTGLPAVREEREADIHEFLESIPEVSAVQGRQVLIDVTDWAFGLQPRSFSSPLATGVYSVKKRVFSGHWVDDFSHASTTTTTTTTTGFSSSSAGGVRASGIAFAGSSNGSLLGSHSLCFVVPPRKAQQILGDVACSFAVPSASRPSETKHAGVSLQSSRDKLRDDAHSSVLQLLNLLGPHSQGLK